MLVRREFLRRSALGLATLPLARAGSAFAADYPTKAVRWVVGYVPAGSTDILARLMGAHLTEKLHQQFIIENKPGAGNNIATEYVINSPPDGYTVYLVNPANGINASLYKKLPFNFVRDMAPVGGIMRVPNVMIVNPNMPVKTVAEYITYAKANPDKVNLISSGNGTSVHLSGELFMAMTGVKMTHVPYKGSNPALTDLVSGQVQGVMFDNMPSCLPLVKGGKLRALAVTTEQRSDQLPDVPTVGETVKGYEASAWFGMGAPAKTPPDVIAVLNKAINEGLADPKIKARLTELGGMPMGGTPADFGKIIVSETEKWKKVVELSGASVE
jgi:tripartite-type tricarboxylate transporter receptor subunit TctC